MLVNKEKVQPRFLRIRHAAVYLGVAPKAIRALILLGKLSYLQVGRNNSPWLIDKIDLDRYIDQNKRSLAETR